MNQHEETPKMQNAKVFKEPAIAPPRLVVLCGQNADFVIEVSCEYPKRIFPPFMHLTVKTLETHGFFAWFEVTVRIYRPKDDDVVELPYIFVGVGWENSGLDSFKNTVDNKDVKLVGGKAAIIKLPIPLTAEAIKKMWFESGASSTKGVVEFSPSITVILRDRRGDHAISWGRQSFGKLADHKPIEAIVVPNGFACAPSPSTCAKWAPLLSVFITPEDDAVKEFAAVVKKLQDPAPTLVARLCYDQLIALEKVGRQHSSGRDGPAEIGTQCVYLPYQTIKHTTDMSCLDASMLFASAMKSHRCDCDIHMIKLHSPDTSPSGDIPHAIVGWRDGKDDFYLDVWEARKQSGKLALVFKEACNKGQRQYNEARDGSLAAATSSLAPDAVPSESGYLLGVASTNKLDTCVSLATLRGAFGPPDFRNCTSVRKTAWGERARLVAALGLLALVVLAVLLFGVRSWHTLAGNQRRLHVTIERFTPDELNEESGRTEDLRVAEYLVYLKLWLLLSCQQGVELSVTLPERPPDGPLTGGKVDLTALTEMLRPQGDGEDKPASANGDNMKQVVVKGWLKSWRDDKDLKMYTVHVEVSPDGMPDFLYGAAISSTANSLFAAIDGLAVTDTVIPQWLQSAANQIYGGVELAKGTGSLQTLFSSGDGIQQEKTYIEFEKYWRCRTSWEMSSELDLSGCPGWTSKESLDSDCEECAPTTFPLARILVAQSLNQKGCKAAAIRCLSKYETAIPICGDESGLAPPDQKVCFAQYSSLRGAHGEAARYAENLLRLAPGPRSGFFLAETFFHGAATSAVNTGQREAMIPHTYLKYVIAPLSDSKDSPLLALGLNHLGLSATYRGNYRLAFEAVRLYLAISGKNLNAIDTLAEIMMHYGFIEVARALSSSIIKAKGGVRNSVDAVINMLKYDVMSGSWYSIPSDATFAASDVAGRAIRKNYVAYGIGHFRDTVCGDRGYKCRMRMTLLWSVWSLVSGRWDVESRGGLEDITYSEVQTAQGASGKNCFCSKRNREGGGKVTEGCRSLVLVPDTALYLAMLCLGESLESTGDWSLELCNCLADRGFGSEVGGFVCNERARIQVTKLRGPVAYNRCLKYAMFVYVELIIFRLEGLSDPLGSLESLEVIERLGSAGEALSKLRSRLGYWTDVLDGPFLLSRLCYAYLLVAGAATSSEGSDSIEVALKRALAILRSARKLGPQHRWLDVYERAVVQLTQCSNVNLDLREGRSGDEVEKLNAEAVETARRVLGAEPAFGPAEPIQRGSWLANACERLDSIVRECRSRNGWVKLAAETPTESIVCPGYDRTVGIAGSDDAGSLGAMAIAGNAQ